MSACARTRLISSTAATAIVALSIAPLTPPIEARISAVAVPDIELTAAPIGAIPLAFLRNQATFCGLICPFIVQGAVTVPVGALGGPSAFAQTLGQTGDLLKAVGAAAASVTQPADDAAEGIIGNDLSLVLPKAQDTLQVAVVQAVDVFTGATSLNTARNKILEALNQPPGPPTVPTGAHGVLEVALVEGINVASAVAFQAGETVLLGVVQTANAAATTLRHTGDVRAAVMAGAQQVRVVTNTARNQITTALHTAVVNITAAQHNSRPVVKVSASANAKPTATSTHVAGAPQHRGSLRISRR